MLGAVCRYHAVPFADVDINDLDEYGADGSDHKKHLPALDWWNLPALCERVFVKYLEKDHVLTKSTALRALGGLFVAHPRQLFAMDQAGLIADVMSKDAHRDLQLESLRCWQDILLVSATIALFYVVLGSSACISYHIISIEVVEQHRLVSASNCT